MCKCAEGFSGDVDRYCSPLFTGKCKQDQDCPEQHGCIDEKCQDLCKTIHPCGSGTVCKVLNNQPMKAISCTCMDGFDGDPEVSCTPS